MLKNSASRNQRLKAKLVFRMLLVLSIGAWMTYHLRHFLSHKLASEDGGPVTEKVIGPQQLKLGRKGLVVPDKNGADKETEDEDETEQGEDDEDEGMDMEPFEENDLLNDTDENANTIERETGDDNSSRKRM